MVFRDYDQAGLEAQYDSASRDPAITALRDERAKRTDAEAARVRRSARAKLDFAYGTHAREKIDVFQASGAGGPVLEFFHGGYWKQRYKDEFAWMAPAFTSRGINLATVGYPLCPQVRIGDIVASCRRAMMQLLAHAPALGFDWTRIHVAGHSAGGHLAAMMAATDFRKHGGPDGLVKSATCVSGLYDLEPLALVTVNAELKITPADVEKLSPMRLAPLGRVPINLAVGDREGEEFLRNTAELSAAWRKRDAEVTTVPAPGRYHFDVLDDFATAGRPLFERVVYVIGA